MNEFYIELNKRRKSIPKLIYGAINVIIAVFLLSSSLFNVLANICIFINGIIFIYEASGKSFGKKYILLTKEYLKMKFFLFKPIIIFNMNEVRSLNVGNMNIEIITSANKLYQYNLSSYDSSVIAAIEKMALTYRDNY